MVFIEKFRCFDHVSIGVAVWPRAEALSYDAACSHRSATAVCAKTRKRTSATGTMRGGRCWIVVAAATRSPPNDQPNLHFLLSNGGPGPAADNL